MKRALVVGSRGQDGSILTEELERRGDAVFGIDVDSGVSLLSRAEVDALVTRVQPEEVYYLAAHHHSAEGGTESIEEEMRACSNVHVVGLTNVLEALRVHAGGAHTFVAGSSHMFGAPTESPQTERTPFAPRTPYAITKVEGAQVCATYRARHGMHVSVGILYNHESPRRSERFVSMKIALAARRAKQDGAYRVTLGSLSAVVDWGYAPDYVDAMMRIVALRDADDFIVATGEPHTVAELAQATFAAVGLDWRVHVVEDAQQVQSAPTTIPLIGNATKLRDASGWSPRVRFHEMAHILVREPAR